MGEVFATIGSLLIPACSAWIGAAVRAPDLNGVSVACLGEVFAASGSLLIPTSMAWIGAAVRESDLNGVLVICMDAAFAAYGMATLCFSWTRTVPCRCRADAAGASAAVSCCDAADHAPSQRGASASMPLLF